MCEWLSCSDWCDVRLMCKGGSFNAHRAVLASVSTLLNRALLSCPVDESPVFIILPEFDFDVMSSVLYYIYNGEVLISKPKLKIFLDTANAMEIFIDPQYIPQTNDYKQYLSERGSGNEMFSIEHYNMCQLRCNRINGCRIDLRKGMEVQELIRLMQKPVDSLNVRDNSIQAFGWSEDNAPNFGNLTSISKVRQRQKCLRDIFIATYSQDGNVNGQTPGVLAISNEDYRAPTSVLFTNTSDKYPSTFNTYKKTLTHINAKPSISNKLKQLQDTDKYREASKRDISIFYAVSNTFKANNLHAETISSKKEPSILWKRIEGNNNIQPDYETIAKVTVLNEVLQSPWHTRQPDGFRPFRKKNLNSVFTENNHQNKPSVSSNNENNSRHRQIQTNKPETQDLKCIVCHEVFTRRQDLSIHMRQHSSITRYSCDECQKTFSQLRNFKYHMSVHRGTKEFAATCSVCGKNFNDRGYLSNHMKIHRNRKEYKCASCPKSFNQRVAFNMHVRIHTGVKPHVCEECGKAFSRKMLLKQHQRTHSGERPYACPHCDKRFADRSNMTLHLRVHTGVKPFSCTLCTKSFTKKHHLKSHLNFHTGSKPYSCPRCKLAFTQSSNMRTHFKKCNAAI